MAIKKFEYDPNKSWEENYKALEKHHIEETTDLFDKLSQARKQISMWHSLGTDKLVVVDSNGTVIGAQG